MGRAATLDTIWPADGDPKTLLCVRVPCSAAELFKTVFVDPELQVQLHKQRNDTALVETLWVGSRQQLPPELYTWPGPPAGEHNEPGAELRYRKVRFESPPTALASKPFQNEETHVLTHWVPDQLYVMEAISNTSAPYGDKFSVYFKYIIRPDGSAPDGSSGSVLHLLFAVDFQPSMNRMMKPVIAKAVDSGVRGTFKIFRSVLGGLRPGTSDMSEAELPPGGLLAGALASYSSSSASESEGEGEGDEERVKKHHHHHHHAFVPAPPVAAPMAPPAAAPGAHPGMVAAPGLLSVISQQLVYKDQVVLLADLVGAGLRSVTHSELGAQGLAALLTVWLISVAVAALRSWQQLCDPRAGGGSAGGDGGGGGGGGRRALLLPVCWPLQLVDVPDSTMEVITSLALVAAINWALIRGSEAAVRYLASKHPALLASVRANAAAAAAAAAGGGGSGGATGLGAGATGGGGGNGVGVVGGLPLGAPPPEAASATAGAAAAAAAAVPGAATRASGGGASGGGAAPAAAAKAAGASSAVAPASSTPAAAAAHGKEKGKGKDKEGKGKKGGSGGGAAAAQKPAPVLAATQSKPLRAAPAPKQFTPEQLRMLEMGTVSSGGAAAGASGKGAAGSRPDTPPAPASAAAPTSSATNPSLISMPDAWATDLPAGMVLPTSPDKTPTPPPSVASPAASVTAATVRSASPPPVTMNRVGTSIDGRSTAGLAAAAAPPRSFTSVRPGADAGSLVSAPVSSASVGGAGGPTPMPSPAGKAPQGTAPPPAVVAAAAAAAAAASGVTSATAAQTSGVSGTSNASSFANMFTKEGIDSMAESFRSAFRWDLKPSDEQHPAEPASPTAGGAAAAGKPNGASASAAAARAAAVAASSFRNPPSGAQRALTVGGGNLSAMSEPMQSMYSARSDMAAAGFVTASSAEFDVSAAGASMATVSEPAVVVEEVFENERFQPFRGWGHMWPGHFLPSDRVGHWSDRQGKPGGTASMVWEQVVPQLPPGWRWVEDEWQIDLDGTEVEAVDGDGWSYALDFYLLKYPPPPQAGKCSLKHFVRRRRLFRTRVRLPDRSLLDSAGDSGIMGLPLQPLSPDGGAAEAAAAGSNHSDLSALTLDPDAPHATLPVSTSAGSAPASTTGGSGGVRRVEGEHGPGHHDNLGASSVLSLAEALPSRSLDSHTSGSAAAGGAGGLGGLGGSAPAAASGETLAGSGSSSVDFRPASLPAISGGAAGGGGWLASPGGMGPTLPRPRSNTTLAGAGGGAHGAGGGGGAEQPHSSSGSGTAKRAVALAEAVSGEARAPAEAAALLDLMTAGIASEAPSPPPQVHAPAGGRRSSAGGGGGAGPGRVSAGVSPSPSPPKQHARRVDVPAPAVAAGGVTRVGSGGSGGAPAPASRASAHADAHADADAGGGHSGPMSRVSTEGYVLSPKTEMKAHDPLGALLQDDVAAALAAAPPPQRAAAKPAAAPGGEAAQAAAGSAGSPSGRQGGGTGSGTGSTASGSGGASGGKKAGGKLGAVPLRRGGSDAAGASAAAGGGSESGAGGEAALQGATSVGADEPEAGGVPARADSGASGGAGGKQQSRAARRAAAAHTRGTGPGAAGGGGSGAGDGEGDLGGGAVVAADLVD